MSDVHVPAPLIQALRRDGIDVLTAREDGSDRLDDTALLDRATALGRVLVTYDRDFWREAARRQSAGMPFAGVFLVTERQTVIGTVAADLVLAASALEPQDMAGSIQSIPLR